MRSLLSLGSVGFFAALAGMFVAFTIGVAMFMATSDDDSGGGGAEPTATQVTADVTISAQNIAFDTDTLTVPAGAPFTLLFQNKEPVPHNVAIYTEEGGSSLFTGDIISAAEIVYEVPALEGGEYFFVCDVHPTQMTGTLIADPAFDPGPVDATGTPAAAETPAES
jgi:plastocyanin